MGAGSAKGLQPEDDEDADKFSTTSSEQWGENDRGENDRGENDRPSVEGTNTDTKNNNKENVVKAVAQISSEALPETSDLTNIDTDEKRNEMKKKSIFNFGRKKDDVDKVDEFVEEPNDDERKEGETKDGDKIKEGSKKDGEKKGGFRLFGWRKDDRKSEEKDAALDKDIDELEKTFDSLGIVGNNLWDEQSKQPRMEAADDLELLEPMRKRKNVRVRGPRGMNGVVAGGGSRGGSEGSSSSRKRNFRYSWETETEEVPVNTDEEEWEYKAVVIEGFDIDKFRKANLMRESVFDSTSLPNAVGENELEGRTMSPLRYDPSEQQILASIERDFKI